MMYPRDLTQPEIDALDAESYSQFLALGDPTNKEPPECEPEDWLEQQRIYDL